MKLIPFAGADNHVVYLNPQHVFAVTKRIHHTGGTTFTNIMTTSGFSYDVLESLETVVNTLVEGD